MRETPSVLAASEGKKERIFSGSVQLTKQNVAQVFNMCIHGGSLI